MSDGLLPAALGVVPNGVLCTYGDGADQDVAFDAAVDRIVHTLGTPAAAGLDPGLVVVVPEAPRTQLQALRAALELAHTRPDDTPAVVAAPYLARSCFARQPVSVPVVGLDLDVPSPGPVPVPDPALTAVAQAALDAIAPAEGLEPWCLDELAVRRRTVRSRVQVSRSPGPSARRFVVVRDTKIVSWHASQSEARRHARDLARADAAESATWQVWAVSGRAHLDAHDAPVTDPVAGLAPLVVAQRTPRTQRAALRAVGTAVKRLRPPAGWVFALAGVESLNGATNGSVHDAANGTMNGTTNGATNSGTTDPLG